MSVDYAKLKTNLNLIMHRLKLVEKKKMELNQKARRTIGEFLNAGKVDRARIRVEQIIREDYIVEAMDLVESYCDFLISRFGQLKSNETVDEGLATAISSLIWVTPYFESDVPELKVISDQLGKKYGKQYVLSVHENTVKTVNETLIKKLSVQVPPKVLVEKYLVEIAKDQKIDYKPDPRIMKENESLSSDGFGQRPWNDDDDHAGGTGGQRANPAHGPEGAGFNLVNLGDHYPMNPITQPSFNPYGQPPPLPSEPPQGFPVPVGPTDLMTDTVDASAPTARIPIGFNVSDSTLDTTGSSSVEHSSRQSSDTDKATKSNVKPLKNGKDSQAHSGADAGGSSGAGPPTTLDGGSPPNYESVVNKPGNETQYYSFGPDSSFTSHHAAQDNLNDTLPELPPVPSSDGPARPPPASSPDDLDSLTKRFEELKNKK